MPKTKQEVLDLMAESRQLQERIARADAQLIADNRAAQATADATMASNRAAWETTVQPMKDRMATIEADLRANA